jgi:glucosylceramidase
MSWGGVRSDRSVWPSVMRVVLVLMAALSTAIIASPSALAANETVQTWLTTTSGSTLVNPMAPQPSLTFGPTSAATTVVSVDPTTTYQTIDGFGGALTDSAAWLIYNSPQRTAIMNDLFGSGGASFSTVRLPMGASDLSLSNYSYDDTCCSLSRFSVAHDTSYIIPILQQARQLNAQMKVMAVPWSAPGWMKFGGSFTGTCWWNYNYLNNSYYPTYASYFAKFVSAYANAYGIPIYAVSMQNEPHNCSSAYATMNMEASDQSNFALQLRSALNNAGFGGVKIISWDNNWYESNQPTTYPQQVLSYNHSQALNAVNGAAYHCYGSPDGGYSVQSTFHGAYPSKDVYFTECTGGTWATNAAANLVWEMQNNLIGPVRNWARTSLYWSIALDPNNGPNVGGCTTCRGMITVDNTHGTYTRNGEYYAWEHLSKVVQPGAVRIASTDLGNGNIQTVAFKNPDGSLAVIALNSNWTSPIPFSVNWGGQAFNYTLPPASVASFTWTPGVPPSPTSTKRQAITASTQG